MRISDWSSDVCSSDLHASLLPFTNGRQSYTVSVGALPNFTYMSASPVPPDRLNARLLEPAGTSMVKLMSLPVLAANPVTATPLVSVPPAGGGGGGVARSEEHTSELQSLMRISYAVFCLKKNTHIT